MRKLSCLKAFTLVELLVVISIIALLLALLMPTLQQARSQAKRAVCASQLKQIGLTIFLYGYDNNDKTPPSGLWAYPGSCWASGVGNQFTEGSNYVPAYLSDKDILYCPQRGVKEIERLWQACELTYIYLPEFRENYKSAKLSKYKSSEVLFADVIADLLSFGPLWNHDYGHGSGLEDAKGLNTLHLDNSVDWKSFVNTNPHDLNRNIYRW
ncbi:MAG: type II secretion system protein [Phycisphaerae bacterium]|nr:type II secretion system protein [Phycisphaerae bacterium]